MSGVDVFTAVAWAGTGLWLGFCACVSMQAIKARRQELREALAKLRADVSEQAQEVTQLRKAVDQLALEAEISRAGRG